MFLDKIRSSFIIVLDLSVLIPKYFPIPIKTPSHSFSFKCNSYFINLLTITSFFSTVSSMQLFKGLNIQNAVFNLTSHHHSQAKPIQPSSLHQLQRLHSRCDPLNLRLRLLQLLLVTLLHILRHLRGIIRHTHGLLQLAHSLRQHLLLLV